MIHHQALAQRKMDHPGEAAAIAQRLVEYGEAHQDEAVSVDYFAVSLPDFLVFDDDLSRRHRLHCRYMAGLGYLALGDAGQASARFDAVLAEDPAHLGAAVHRNLAQTNAVQPVGAERRSPAHATWLFLTIVTSRDNSAT